MALEKLRRLKGRGFNRLGRLFPRFLLKAHTEIPLQVDIELTNSCNLHCKMCWFHGENGIGDRYKDCELATSEVFSVVDQLAEHTGTIYIGGAEPLMRRDFMSILRHMKSRNMSVSFATNGTLLDYGKIETLVELGVDGVFFSIDGNEAVHDQIRGKGIFRKVTRSVKELSEHRQKAVAIKPVITVNITLTSSLVGHLKDAVNEIRASTDDGPDFYRLHHLWYITENELSRHQAVVRQKIGCGAPGAASHTVPASLIRDPRSLADEISSLKNWPKVRSFPNLRHADILTYYSEVPNTGQRCIAPFFAAVIKPNGDVRFCPDEWIDDYTLGNLRNDSFHNIWNNEKAYRFRSSLLREKSFTGCRRCVWMYSHR